MTKSKNGVIKFVIAVILLVANNLSAQFLGGNGTETNPYQISTPSQLSNLRDYLGTNNATVFYKLVNDIDMTTYLSSNGAGFNDGAFWMPIGSEENQFNGKLDGNGFKIKGLKINRDAMDVIGLFGSIGITGLVKNLAVEMDLADLVKGKTYVGLIAGINYGFIRDCHTSGRVWSVSSYVGGLIGVNYGGIVTNCYTDCEVYAYDYYAGGLIGCNYGGVYNCYTTGATTGAFGSGGGVAGENDGLIENSYATGPVHGGIFTGGIAGSNNGIVSLSHASGNVDGSAEVGGIVGDNRGDVSNCYSSSEVIGTSDAIGGLVGSNHKTIIKSYATGAVYGYGYVGGLVGDNEQNTTINDCYATGSISGNGALGGLIGQNKSIVKVCYATGSVVATGGGAGGLVGSNYAPIIDCYATGSAIAGTDFSGGLAAINHTGTITRCYATGATNSVIHMGGILGLNTSFAIPDAVTFSYWDINTTGQTSSSGSDAAIYGKTTDQMKLLASFTGWNFNSIWSIDANINQGYPYLTSLPVEIKQTNAIASTQLLNNYPNPFNPSTAISFEIKNSGLTKLFVYNAKGELVKTLVNGIQNTGFHSVDFDGTGLNSGVYFYKLDTNGESIVKRMLLVK